jgi:hypothetical protein
MAKEFLADVDLKARLLLAGGAGSAGQVFTSGGAGAPPSWQTPSLVSNPAGITGADAVSNIVSLTQAEYDAIATPNAATLYVITD